MEPMHCVATHYDSETDTLTEVFSWEPKTLPIDAETVHDFLKRVAVMSKTDPGFLK